MNKRKANKKDDIHINLDGKLKHAFRVATVIRGTDMTEAIIKYIEKYVEEGK